MNVGDAKIADGKLWIGEDGVAIPDKWRKLIGKRESIKFGIRPEHVNLSQGSGDLRVKITYVENHGNKLCVAYTAGGNDMMVTLDPFYQLGEDMYMNL